MRTDFDLKALFAAIDAQRDARGLTWAAAAREIAGALPSALVRPVASSTIWLDHAPESFIRNLPRNFPKSDLPERPASRVLRFDTRKLHAAIDAERQSTGLTWQQAGEESGAPVSHLRHSEHKPQGHRRRRRLRSQTHQGHRRHRKRRSPQDQRRHTTDQNQLPLRGSQINRLCSSFGGPKFNKRPHRNFVDAR